MQLLAATGSGSSLTTTLALRGVKDTRWRMFAAVATIAAIAAADNCPPLDRYITLNAEYGPRARIVNAVSLTLIHI